MSKSESPKTTSRQKKRRIVVDGVEIPTGPRVAAVSPPGNAPNYVIGEAIDLFWSTSVDGVLGARGRRSR